MGCISSYGIKELLQIAVKNGHWTEYDNSGSVIVNFFMDDGRKTSIVLPVDIFEKLMKDEGVSGYTAHRTGG